MKNIAVLFLVVADIIALGVLILSASIPRPIFNKNVVTKPSIAYEVFAFSNVSNSDICDTMYPVYIIRRHRGRITYANEENNRFCVLALDTLDSMYKQQL